MTALLFGAVILSSCNKDDNREQEIPTEQTITANATVFGVQTLDPALKFADAATYQWSVESASSELHSLTDTNKEMALFTTSEAGTYKLKVTATKDGKSYVRHIALTVKASDKTPSPFIAKIFDFMPAVGQFTNKLPAYESANTKADMIAKAQTSIVGKKSGGLISLGGFGGYIVFGFDHTITNVKGLRDLRIMGNAFYAAADTGGVKGGSCEPGIIMVAYDANHNGKPDDNEWYEIAGSEYHKPTTIKDYQINYHRPQSEEPTDATQYIHWDDNKGASGYKSKNAFHKQPYFPSWVLDAKLTLTGTCLPGNAIDQNGDGSYWVLTAYGYGYADNAPNNEDDSAIDIDWAVDAKGAKVELPGIDFVKIHTGVNQEAGWLGEVSTDITGAYDLHISKETIKN